MVRGFMRIWLPSPHSHLALVSAFCLLIIPVWMMPVFLAGFPFTFTTSVKVAEQFAQTGTLQEILNPLFTLFLRVLSSFIDWRDATAWAMVSAVTLAIALIPLWWSISRLFDRRVAWASIVLFSFMPMYWKEAISTGYYPLAFLCLFLGFALFLRFIPHHHITAVALLGFCYGLTLATTHAFFPLLPWFLCIYLWEYRRRWQKAMQELTICGAFAYAGFVLPLLPIALQPNLSTEQRLGVLLPIEENLMQPSELYGDDYAYEFLKEEFDEKMRKQSASPSFIERRDNENFRINYKVDSFSPLHIALNGSWLFINAVASLFMQEIVGGVFLWLFILPGLVSLWRTHRRILLQLLGLWLSMELILRFGFHYARIHLMDVGWIVAIVAGAGVLFIAQTMRHTLPTLRTSYIAGLILLLTSLQLTQANRKLFSQEYMRSGIPRARAAAEAIQMLPKNAIIAQPQDDQLLIFTDRTSIVLQNETIDMLAAKGNVADPFRRYGITHIIGYDAEHAALIKEAIPQVEPIVLANAPPVPLTSFKRYLLNLIR